MYPKEDTESAKEQREKMMAKILKIIEAKNRVREKELREMDAESDAAMSDNEGEDSRAVKKTKQIQRNDEFFTGDDD